MRGVTAPPPPLPTLTVTVTGTAADPPALPGRPRTLAPAPPNGDLHQHSTLYPNPLMPSTTARPPTVDVDRVILPRRTWQLRLLPFMVTMVVGLTIFFVIATYLQLDDLSDRILAGPSLDLTPALEMEMTDDFTAHWRALTILEGHAMQQRYHQANVLLMSRVWIRYLGFLTGMILALLGAAFVLGKLRTSDSSASAEASGWKLSLNSASPGLMLAALGTILMIVALVTNPAVRVSDGRAFLGNENSPLPGVEQ